MLKGAALESFLLCRQGRHWDGVPALWVRQDDLDPQAFRLFVQKAAQKGMTPGCRYPARHLEDGSDQYQEKTDGFRSNPAQADHRYLTLPDLNQAVTDDQAEKQDGKQGLTQAVNHAKRQRGGDSAQG